MDITTTERDELKHITFKDLCRDRARAKMKYYDDAHFNLTADFVTMAKRNDGDYLGVMRDGRRNAWNDVKLSKGFVTFPVIPRALRAKTATAVSTDIDLDFEAALKIPEKKAAAEMASNCYKYFEELHWTERLETVVAMLGQIGRFAAILTERYEDGGLTVAQRELSAPKWMKTREDSISCMNCGAEFDPQQLGVEPIEVERTESSWGGALPIDESGEVVSSWNGNVPKQLKDGEPEEFNPAQELKRETQVKLKREIAGNQAIEIAAIDDDDFDPKYFGKAIDTDEEFSDLPPRPLASRYDLSKTPCPNPNCGEFALGILDEADHELQDVPTGESEPIKVAKIVNTVVSPLLVRYDDVHTIGFDWQKAHWLNYHPVETVYELIEEHPELKKEIGGQNVNEWSESTRWYLELTKGSGNTTAPNQAQAGMFNELVEVDYWFYQPVMCGGWREPERFELVKNGQTTFTIEAGETIEEAFRRQNSAAPFKGLLVKMVGDHILDVANVSFTDFFTLVGWNLSVTGHVPRGEEHLLKLQDAATRVLSMMYSAVQRNTNPKGIVDGRFWNKAELLSNQPAQWHLSKLDIDTGDQPFDISKTIGYIAPPSMSSAVDNFIQLIIQIAKEESGVYDETVGNANVQNQTKGGRELALNQSLGLMTPTQKAKKEGKIAWTRVMLKMWQTFPDEAFTLIKGTFEEEWKADDIAAFKALDIDNELIISAVEGTDVPKTRPQMLQNMQIAMEMGLLSDQPMIPLEIAQKILKEVLGIDYDINNFEADRRLAGRRHEAAKLECKLYAESLGIGYDQLIEIVEQPVDPTNLDPLAVTVPVRQLHSDIIASFAQDLRIKVRPEDNHPVFIGYYVDQIKAIAGSREPREIDLLVLEYLIDQHNQIIATIEQKKLQAQQLIASAGAPPVEAPPPEASQQVM